MIISQERMGEILAHATVVPVITIERLEDAVPLANALVDGGLSVLEVTLRTNVALTAISRMVREVPMAVIGAGTVLTPSQLDDAEKAGASFAVSPGCTPRLIAAGIVSSIPLLPGAATASEMMKLLEEGYRYQKFFPAEAMGGISYLKMLASPLAEIRFCPTGGINASTAKAYLAESTVVAVGGSWMAPMELIHKRDWMAITALANEVAQVVNS